MPYSKAVEIADDFAKDQKNPASEKAVENAKKVAKLIYDTYPNLDTEGKFFDLKMHPTDDGISVELFREFKVWAFKCRNDGTAEYYQHLPGKRFENVLCTMDYENLPSDKIIIQHIKRKRFPYDVKKK